MPWDATLPANVNAGSPILGADENTVLAILTALTAPWQDFSGGVNWTSAGTAPTIGNGSIVAAYRQVGKDVVYQGRINMGSTTTYGSANAWTIALPVTAANTNFSGAVYLAHSAVTANKNPGAIIPGLSVVSFASSGGPVALSVPFAWASGDFLTWTINYQAA